jgi:hypothetical protein
MVYWEYMFLNIIIWYASHIKLCKIDFLCNCKMRYLLTYVLKNKSSIEAIRQYAHELCGQNKIFGYTQYLDEMFVCRTTSKGIRTEIFYNDSTKLFAFDLHTISKEYYSSAYWRIIKPAKRTKGYMCISYGLLKINLHNHSTIIAVLLWLAEDFLYIFIKLTFFFLFIKIFPFITPFRQTII